MKKGCLFSLSLLAALCGGYYVVFSHFFYPPGDHYGALVAGLFAWLSIGLLQNARRHQLDAQAIGRALSGDIPKDGKLFAAVGAITPVGEALTAPFSAERCCAYAYEIGEPDSFSSHDGVAKAFSGFALTRSVINTPGAQVKLLGLPILDSLPEEFLRDAESAKRAQEFVRDGRFDVLNAMQILKAVSSLTAALTESDGAVEKNWRITKDNDLSGLLLCERRLAVGQQVCILGTYSQMHGGIVPSLSKGQINRIIPETPQAAMKSLRSSFVAAAVGGVLLFSVTTAAGFGLLSLRERSEDILQAKSEALFYAVQEQQLDEVGDLIARGAPLERRNDQEVTPLMTAYTKDIAEILISAGADISSETESGHTPLMEAAQQNNIALAEVLIARGANVNAVSRKYGASSIQIAESKEHAELAELLRRAATKQ